MSCGNSSILNQRRIWPTRVTRGSRLTVSREPIWYAPVTIVRNLKIRNSFPPSPTRSWRKNTGPGLSSLIRAATSSRNGSNTIKPTTATRTSALRFSIKGLPSVVSKNTGQRVRHPVHVRHVHARVQRERDDPPPGRTGIGELVCPIAEHLAIVTMLVQRNEVHARADTRFRKTHDDFVPINSQLLWANPHDEEMPGVLDLRPARWELDLVHPRQGSAVALHERPPFRLQRRHAFQLDESQGSVHVRHVVLEARVRNVVPPRPRGRVALPGISGHAVQAPAAQPIAQC